jgi:hypothetical protein
MPKMSDTCHLLMLPVTHPLRQLRFSFIFVFSSRDRILEFLRGLAHTIPSLILLHVTTSVNILSRILLQGTLVPSIPETRKPGIIRIYGPDHRPDQRPGLNPDILPFGISSGVFTPIPPMSRTLVALDLRHTFSTNGWSKSFRDSSFLPQDLVR